MKKFLLVFLALVTFSGALFAQYGGERKIEFSILGGYGLSSFEGTSSYSDSWNDGFWLDNVSEDTLITLAKKNSFTLGAKLDYFFSPNFGLEVGGGYFAPKADVTSDWNFAWDWHFDGSYSDSGSWAPTEAQLTSIPLYINLVGKYETNMFDIFVSAGPAIFFNTVKADAHSIYGDFIFPWIDWFDIPLSINETNSAVKNSWTGFGFNVGGGFDLHFTPSVALTVDARYFYCAKKDIAWTWTTGEFEGFNGNLIIDYSNFTTAQGLTTPLTINPSFFSIMGGFKFFF